MPQASTLDRRRHWPHDAGIDLQERAMVNPLRRRWLLASLAFGCSVAGSAWAAGISKAETKKVRAVIEAQLAAFADDDAKRAFSYAAPAIREMFGTPEQFMAMVRQSYPVVYRPASVSFLQPEAIDGLVIQAVEMTDGRGGVWTAVYRLQRQRDRSWRISACEVAPSDARST
jgi:Domain of unknown function (DUF4864)